jgi:hypothetical protein
MHVVTKIVVKRTFHTTSAPLTYQTVQYEPMDDTRAFLNERRHARFESSSIILEKRSARPTLALTQPGPAVSARTNQVKILAFDAEVAEPKSAK